MKQFSIFVIFTINAAATTLKMAYAVGDIQKAVEIITRENYEVDFSRDFLKYLFRRNYDMLKWHLSLFGPESLATSISAIFDEADADALNDLTSTLESLSEDEFDSLTSLDYRQVSRSYSTLVSPNGIFSDKALWFHILYRKYYESPKLKKLIDSLVFVNNHWFLNGMGDKRAISAIDDDHYDIFEFIVNNNLSSNACSYCIFRKIRFQVAEGDVVLAFFNFGLVATELWNYREYFTQEHVAFLFSVGIRTSWLNYQELAKEQNIPIELFKSPEALILLKQFSFDLSKLKLDKLKNSQKWADSLGNLKFANDFKIVSSPMPRWRLETPVESIKRALFFSQTACPLLCNDALRDLDADDETVELIWKTGQYHILKYFRNSREILHIPPRDHPFWLHLEYVENFLKNGSFVPSARYFNLGILELESRTPDISGIVNFKLSYDGYLNIKKYGWKYVKLRVSEIISENFKSGNTRLLFPFVNLLHKRFPEKMEVRNWFNEPELVQMIKENDKKVSSEQAVLVALFYTLGFSFSDTDTAAIMNSDHVVKNFLNGMK